MKKIKIFVGALLCMNLLTISGCDKVVHSAVVEEKDKTVVKTEENKEKRNSSRKQSLNRCRLRKPTRQPSSPI